MVKCGENNKKVLESFNKMLNGGNYCTELRIIHAIREEKNNSSRWCFTLKKEQIIWMKLLKMVLFGHYTVIAMSQNTSKAQRKAYEL